MSKLKPLKLHEIIGTSTEWTDELWDEALTYLLERTGTMQAMLMVEVVPSYSHQESSHFFKVDYLREFRQYPPTLLLGAFDFMRSRWSMVSS